MDGEIEDQLGRTNQVQQNKGKAVNGQAVKATSIDVEAMKLKRLTDKRGQMFDLLRQAIDKYNQTARGMIQAIGR